MWTIWGLLLCTCALVLAAKECSITLPEDLKGFAPIILLNGRTQLFQPNGKVTTFAEGTALHLVCTGKRNIIESVDSSTMDITCSKGQFVDAKKAPVVLNTLLCKSMPESKLTVTQTKCANNQGVIYVAGVEVYNQFHAVLEMCYDINTETTFYTHHTLRGNVVNYNIPESARPSFVATGTKFKNTVVNEFYTQKNQVKVFEKSFGAGQTYIDTKNYLARGHLSPDADFMFGYEQFSTYYYTNAAPQYQTVNAGNWLKIENLARSLAGAYGDDIESYNGYMGMVQFPKRGKMTKVYLDEYQQFPIPKYYYKVLLHKSSSSAIVFMSVNNPFATAGKADEICTNVCEKAKMNQAYFADASKGYTFCCALDDFQKSFKHLPKEVKAKNLLMWKENTEKTKKIRKAQKA